MRLLIPLIALMMLAALASGCGSGDDGDGPTIAVTTGIWADITEEIAGEGARVEQIIPDGTSPHDFQLSAQDRAEIEDSLLLVYNGAELEAGIPIGDLDATAFAMTDHAGQLRPSDPHVWMDPSRVAEAVPALADELAQADPDHAAGYRKRAEDYVEELRALDAEVRSMFDAIPPDNRKLVTSHDALGYFADAFGFEVIATPFPASGPESEPSAQTIAEVEDAIRTSGVPRCSPRTPTTRRSSRGSPPAPGFGSRLRCRSRPRGRGQLHRNASSRRRDHRRRSIAGSVGRGLHVHDLTPCGF